MNVCGWLIARILEVGIATLFLVALAAGMLLYITWRDKGRV